MSDQPKASWAHSFDKDAWLLDVALNVDLSDFAVRLATCVMAGDIHRDRDETAMLFGRSGDVVLAAMNEMVTYGHLLPGQADGVGDDSMKFADPATRKAAFAAGKKARAAT